MVEQQRYSVVELVDGGVEVREYPEHHVVSVDVRADIRNAGNLGFRPLVNYISGFNSSSQNIAMTAPVLQSPMGSGQHRVSFVLPHQPGDVEWPEPVDSQLQLEKRPPCLVAALRFRGSWSQELAESKRVELLGVLESSAYKAVSEPFFARYNPPTTPGFMRRNEVLVEVELTKSDPPQD